MSFILSRLVCILLISAIFCCVDGQDTQREDRQSSLVADTIRSELNGALSQHYERLASLVDERFQTLSSQLSATNTRIDQTGTRMTNELVDIRNAILNFTGSFKSEAFARDLETVLRSVFQQISPMLQGGVTQSFTGGLDSGNLSTEASQASNSAIRLVGGLSDREGRLEVFYNNEWGTVCDDEFGDFDATVACLSLNKGFRRGGVVGITTSGSGRIWMDDVFCPESATSLFDCTHRGWGVSNCGHNEDVFIECHVV